MSTRPASTLEYALIGLLRQQAQSGYDLRRTFAMTPMRHYSDSPGSIYPALRRLESRGWVSSAPEPDNARRRRVFRPTPAGTAALITWLRQPLTHDDIVWRMEEVLLRFALFDGNVPRSAAADFLEQLEHELTEYCHELRDFAASIGSRLPLTGRLAFENGVDRYTRHLAWTRQAREQLAQQLT